MKRGIGLKVGGVTARNSLCGCVGNLFLAKNCQETLEWNTFLAEFCQETIEWKPFLAEKSRET
jgi:hypothetical protein